MGNTYTQIHMHAVFAVQSRVCVIRKRWQEDLYRYITGIVQNHGHKMLAINGMPDHVHLFFGMRPTEALSDLMQDIKGDTSRWINEQRFIGSRFSWQEGYGAFSYGMSQVPLVIKYIRDQEEHHRKRTFAQEYRQMLEKFEVNFDDRYVFDPIEYDASDVQ